MLKTELETDFPVKRGMEAARPVIVDDGESG